MVRSCFIAAALAVFAFTAVAQDNDAVPKPTVKIPLFNVQVAFAPPPWANTSTTMDKSEIYRDQTDNGDGTETFNFEFIPKGQSFDAWEQLYAIFAAKDVNGTLIDHGKSQLVLYNNACQAMEFHVLRETEKHLVFIVFCTAYHSNPSQGEIAAFSMKMVEGTLIKNYLHRRLGAYSVDDIPQRDNLPVGLMQDILRVGAMTADPK